MDAEKVARGLTEAQRRGLLADRSRGETAYDMHVGLNTLHALYIRRLVHTGGSLRRAGGLGAFAFPHTSIQWHLTPLGLAVRAILQKQDHD